MMSADKVARIISELHGLPFAKAERIARAAARRRRAATECSDCAHDECPGSAPEMSNALRIPVDALAREISANSRIPLGDALSIAGRVIARVSSWPGRPST
jgi:hypothetical protein